MRKAKILATGMYVPDFVVTNDLLAQVMDTSDEWITQRTGIKERRVVYDTYRMLQRLAQAPDKDAFLKELYERGLDGHIDATMTTSDLALAATEMALKQANLTAADLDLIIQTSVVPDYAYPGVACVLADKLGLTSTPTFSMNQGCAGFIFALSLADQYIKTGTYNTVLVVGAELLSSFFEYSNRGRDMSVLFADGAGAAILVPAEEGEPSGLISHHLHTDGTLLTKLYGEVFGTTTFPPVVKKKIDDDRVRPRMDGRAVFVYAVRRFREVILECLEANRLRLEDIDHFFFHQANTRILEAIAESLNIPREKIPVNIDRYGNTSAASVPILLHEACQEGRLRRGDLCLLVAFGTGFNWGATLLRW
ncbi:MAG: 3-oxoacyl-[acyl-carrier-protein] synthase 3 [Candidatus Tectimicrobiota bacterium]|nr:MAG: 3-oxoacyl-[acyl-carrier-protein] synthase 3 [Candidatus Tectomicrobia bacterium]